MDGSGALKSAGSLANAAEGCRIFPPDRPIVNLLTTTPS